MLLRSLDANRVIACSVLLAIAAALAPHRSHAQPAPVVVQGPPGVEFRYRGDTIWETRADFRFRAVYRMDTVFVGVFRDGRAPIYTTYLLANDSARMLDRHDASGDTSRASFRLLTIGSSAPLSHHTGLVAALLSADMRSLVSAGPTSLIPRAPATPIAYLTRAGMTAVHHGDTVRVTAACPGVATRDTLVWILFGADSVRRMSRPPVTYDRRVANALLLELAGSVLVERFKSTPAFARLPGPTKGTCGK